MFSIYILKYEDKMLMLFKETEAYLTKPMHAVQINTELLFTFGRSFLVELAAEHYKRH